MANNPNDPLGKWDKKVDAKIEAENKPTFKKSRHKVAELLINRDDPDSEVLIAGQEWSLPIQSSLLIAFDKILERRLGTGVDFDFASWRDAFEDGFPDSAATPAEATNIKRNPWGKPYGNRPRCVEVKNIKYGKMIKLFPDRDNLFQYFLFTGVSLLECSQQLMIFWNIYRNLENKNIGTWLGYPLPEYLRIYPRIGLSLCINLCGNPTPPFTTQRTTPSGDTYTIQPRELHIPFAKKEAITYTNLRAICGSATGLEWGHWSARAYMSTNRTEEKIKGLSQIVASGNTQTEANNNLDRFLSLTSLYEVHRSHTFRERPKSKGNNFRYDAMMRYKVYPGWCYILNSRLMEHDEKYNKGRRVASGVMLSDDAKLPLWLEQEPSNWAEIVSKIVLKLNDTP